MFQETQLKSNFDSNQLENEQEVLKKNYENLNANRVCNFNNQI
jgi:hypothetical protein